MCGRAGAPDVDTAEQEDPHHIDEMPIPGCGLEAEMMIRLEMAQGSTGQTNGQEYGADNDMEPLITNV